MKKIVLLLLLFSPIYPDAIDLTFSITREVWRIKFHSEPLACSPFGIDTVCTVEIPKEFNSLILSGLNQQTYYSPNANCCGEHSNSYLELINWTDNTFLKLYFWSCDFGHLSFKINDLIYGIKLSQEANDFLYKEFRKYGIPFYTKRGLDSIRTSQNLCIKKFQPLVDHLNHFDKNALDIIARPAIHGNSTKNQTLSSEIDSLTKSISKDNVLMEWDTTNFKFKIIPKVIQNPDSIKKYFEDY
jgi:hypothetical protein